MQEATIQCVSIDRNGKYLAAVNNMGHCHIWSLFHDSQNNILLLKPMHQIVSHPRQALRCKFSPDSSLVFKFYTNVVLCQIFFQLLIYS